MVRREGGEEGGRKRDAETGEDGDFILMLCERRREGSRGGVDSLQAVPCRLLSLPFSSPPSVARRAERVKQTLIP